MNTTASETVKPSVTLPADRSTWPKSYRYFYEQCEKSLESRVKVFNQACMIEKLIDAMPEVGASAAYWGSTIEITAYPKALMDVVPLIRALRLAGFPRPLIEDSEEQRLRSYIMGNLTVRVYLHADGGACKFVQTGTKEVPIYTMKCDGAEISDIEAAPVDHGLTDPSNQPAF